MKVTLIEMTYELEMNENISDIEKEIGTQVSKGLGFVEYSDLYTFTDPENPTKYITQVTVTYTPKPE